MKYLPMTSCSYCPYRETGPADAGIGYLPSCMRVGRALPYELGAGLHGRVIALPTNALPDWCPLPENPVPSAK